MKSPEWGWLAAVATTVLGGSGIWALLAERVKTKAKQPADLQTSLATFSASLNKDARDIIDTLRAERATLLARIDQQDDRIEQLEHENLQCRGENAQMVQRFESLGSYLRRHGIDVPATGLTGSFITLDGDASTVLSAGPKAT